MCTHLCEFPEAEHECAERVRDPLGALHFADAFLALASVDIILDTVDEDRLLSPKRAEPVLARARLEGECERWGSTGFGHADEARHV